MDPKATPAPGAALTPPQNTVPPGAQANTGVAPMGTVGAGPMTPVQGTENLGGGSGGGIASAAKGQARKAGAAMSGGSAAQMGGGD